MFVKFRDLMTVILTLTCLISINPEAFAKPGPDGERIVQKISGVYPLYLNEIRYQISKEKEYLELGFTIVTAYEEEFKSNCLGLSRIQCRTHLKQSSTTALYPAQISMTRNGKAAGELKLLKNLRTYGHLLSFIHSTLKVFIDTNVLGKDLTSYLEFRDFKINFSSENSFKAEVIIEEWTNGANANVVEILPSSNQPHFDKDLGFLQMLGL